MLLCSYFTVQPVASPGVSRRVVLEPLLPYTEYQLVARARLGPATIVTSDTVYFSTASRGLLEFSYFGLPTMQQERTCLDTCY